jgi:hypothetical protein
MRYALSVPAVARTRLLRRAGAGAGVKVARATDEELAPRPADCPLEFLRKEPSRPYDELADLETHVTSPPSYGAGALEVLRPEACRLGADAVIVRRNFVTNEYGHVLVAGTAIRYRAEPPAQPEPEPAPEAPRGPVNL